VRVLGRRHSRQVSAFSLPAWAFLDSSRVDVSIVPFLFLLRTKASEQLLSTDTHSGTSSYKFTYSIEIAPVCKDDLVCVPQKQARSLSNIKYVATLALSDYMCRSSVGS
jgi:hypothetical protein